MLGAVMLLGCVGAMAQEIGPLDAPAAKATQYVEYAAEGQTVRAGKLDVVELHFRVVEGFHVNSHTPKSELLIPTRVELQPAVAVKMGTVEYPAGKEYSFSFDPKEKLDVYSGGFTVKVPVVAQAGAHEMDGTLRYQACDRAACYPPKVLPVRVLITAK